MSCDFIKLGICFQYTSAEEAADFGIGLAEVLTAVAILLVAYNAVDERYKFRIAISRIEVPRLLFFGLIFLVPTLVGVPLWFERELPLPSFLNNPLYLQGMITIIFSLPILYWLFVAYIAPPRFKASNAEKFAWQLYGAIGSGHEGKMTAIAQELGRSIEDILAIARKRKKVRDFKNGGFERIASAETQIANDLIYMLADKRFCRVIVNSAPNLAADIFYHVEKEGVGSLPLSHFSKNVAAEFFTNKNSAIYHEGNFYEYGLFGHHKPISRDLFGHSRLIEELAEQHGSPLDLMYTAKEGWDHRSWEVYNNAVALFLEDHFKNGQHQMHSYAVNQIFSSYRSACIDAYKIESMSEDYHASLPYAKIRIVINFINDSLRFLNEQKIFAEKKSRRDEQFYHEDIYDHLAQLAVELMSNVSSIQTPDFRNWAVQHNLFWSNLIGPFDESEARKIFLARFQRCVLKELENMDKYMNFKNAKILGLCLNVMGLDQKKGVNKPRKYRAFKRIILALTRDNYLKIHREQPKVAAACISGTISFDSNKNQLIKTYAEGLSGNAPQEFLRLRMPRKSRKTRQ